MVPHAGTDTRIFREVSELGRELASVPEIAGTRVARPTAALVTDWDSWRALELDSHPSTALRLPELALGHYRPLFEAGVACDVVPPDRDLSGYRLVVVPNLYLLTERAAERLTAYVRGGGHLLVSFFSGVVDACDRVHPGGCPGPLRSLLGLRVEEFWPLDEGATVGVRGVAAVRRPGGPGRAEAAAGAWELPSGTADLWSEAILLEGAEPVARFADGELAGSPAVTRHGYGTGTVTYVGTRLEPALMRALMDGVRAAAGVRPVLAGLPEGVQATVREGDGGRFLFLLNHGARAADITLPCPMADALAGARGERSEHTYRIALPARGVAVLKDPRRAVSASG